MKAKKIKTAEPTGKTMTYHLCYTTRYMAAMVEARGVEAVFPNFDGTKDECLDALRNHPTGIIPLAECDNRDADGRCLGHIRGKDDDDGK